VTFSEHLVDRVRAQLARIDGVSELRMFGGWCATVDGNIAVGVMDNDLIVRVGAEAYVRCLALRGARPFDVTGRAMTGWVFVEHSSLVRDRSLASWVDRGVVFAQTLPPKYVRTSTRR